MIVKSNGDKIVVAYDKDLRISFFRPLSGVELTMSNDDLVHRLRFRMKKWSQSHASDNR
jgi:hypothetical protein